MTDINLLIMVLSGSGLVNALFAVWMLKLSLENRQLKFELWQRERWHERENNKWRERL